MNENGIKLIEDTRRLLLIRYPSFADELAKINISYRTDLKYHTGATDGKNVFLDPEYFSRLDVEGRLFLLAHEFMHVKLKHPKRMFNSDGTQKDVEIFNIAADAVINANLERDGFTISEGYVNRPEALQYNIEEFYEILLKEKQEHPQKMENSFIKDDHSLWEESFKNQMEQTSESQESEYLEINDKLEFEKNRLERKKIAEQRYKKMQEQLLENLFKKKSHEIKLENIGKSKDEIDWKNYLRREREKSEIIWSQRRSIAENNYAYRLEENEIEDEAETEVMIDISGSVNLDLVKAFLRIVKIIFRNSKMRIGCFNAKFWGWKEIESIREIDNFTLPAEARGVASMGTDLDLAARSFTKEKKINKIVFTDGYPSFGMMPKEDLKSENILWLVYGNENFCPCCGKVIQITESQLKQLNNVYEEDIYNRKCK